MNRTTFQLVAEERVQEAAALLGAGKWSGAYYLAGYAIECGLKACILARVERTGEIFRDRKFAEKCWTHNLEELLCLAGLEGDLGRDIQTNPSLSQHWARAKGWLETSRYELKTQADARGLYDAVAEPNNGVLPWIRSRW